jgi:uncharacterized protein (UPF0276 family)
LATSRRIDWLEIIPENFVDYGGFPAAVLARCAERWPVVTHGVSLSIGGPDPIDFAFLDRVGQLQTAIGSAWWSEHLCFAGGKGLSFHDLLPLPFTAEAVDHVSARARVVQERIERPLLLENITAYAEVPGGTMDEAAFIRAVLDESAAGLLLDLNNLYVNAHNGSRDAVAALRGLPADRVGQIHLAGHTRAPPPFEELLYDTHATPVADPVWALYREALALCGPIPTLIEWDARIPALDVVLDEADRARAIMTEICGA